MTTLRDVIAKVLSDFYHDGRPSPAAILAGNDVLAALLSAPDLEPHPELAAKLNPWRQIGELQQHFGAHILCSGSYFYIAPAPPSEDG